MSANDWCDLGPLLAGNPITNFCGGRLGEISALFLVEIPAPWGLSTIFYLVICKLILDFTRNIREKTKTVDDWEILHQSLDLMVSTKVNEIRNHPSWR